MDWQTDTPPKVIYQSVEPFGQSLRRRSFDDYAEGQHLEIGRSNTQIPTSITSDTAYLGSLAGRASATVASPYTTISTPTQAGVTSFHPQSHTTVTTQTSAYSQWLASRREIYGEHGKAWRYLCQTIDTIGYGIAAIIQSHTMQSFCFTGYQAGRYLFTKNRRIIKSYTVVTRSANGAKRRIIDITRHYGPPKSADRVLLSPDQRRLLRYREKIRSCANGHDRSPKYAADRVAGTAKDSPNPLGYYMSGGLQPIESPTKGPQVPGAWVSPPRYERETARSLSTYDPNSNDDTNTLSDGATADEDGIVTNIKITDPCAECMKPKANDSAEIAAESSCTHGEPQSTTTDDHVEVKSPDEAIKSEATSKAATLSPQDAINEPPKTDNVVQLSPTSAQCVNPDGEVVPAALEIQRYFDRYRKNGAKATSIGRHPRQPKNVGRYHPFDTNLRALERSTKAFVSKHESPLDTVADLPDTPISQPSPTAAWDQDEVSDSPAWSYGKRSPTQVLSSPPVSFPLPRAAKASSPKKRVVFYSSPKTGQPVSRFKKYVIGARIDDSYNSSPSENSLVVSDDSNFSIYDESTVGVVESPTMQEQQELGSPMQDVEYTASSAIPSSSTCHTSSGEQIQQATPSQATPQSPPVTPEYNTGEQWRKTPSPSDQLLRTVNSPVNSQSPPEYSAPLPILKQVINGVLRRPEISKLAVTAEGSPIRIRPSSTSARIAGATINGNTLSPPDGRIASVSSGSPPTMQNINVPSSTQTDVSIRPCVPLSSVGTQVSENGLTPPSENPEAKAISHYPVKDETSYALSGLTSASVQSSSQSSRSSEISAQRDSFSSAEEKSCAAANGSLSPKEEDSSLLTELSDTSTQSDLSPPKPTENRFQAGGSFTAEERRDASANHIPSSNQETGNTSSRQAEVPAVASSTMSNASEPHHTESSSIANENDDAVSITSSPHQTSNRHPSSQGESVDPTTVDPISVDPVTADPVTVDPVKAADPVTPERVAKQLFNLDISGRKHYLRSSSKAESDDRRRAREEARAAEEKARKEKEEAEERARKAKEAREERLKSGARRMPVGPVIEPLPSEWETKVNQALGAENGSKTVASSLGGVGITRRDIGKILPQPGTGDDPAGWLNDEVVTAYLQIIVEHGLKAAGHKRGETPSMHAFNTFFYKNLDEKGPQSVARWAKKAKIGEASLLNVERVFIPVNMHGSHWTLLVVSPKFRTIEYFDSFHGGSARQIQLAKAWLKLELKDLYKEEQWKVIGRAGPKQNNGSDCGVFVSTTAKMVMLGVDPMAYSAKDIPTQRRRIVAELMNSGFGGALAPKITFPEDD